MDRGEIIAFGKAVTAIFLAAGIAGCTHAPARGGTTGARAAAALADTDAPDSVEALLRYDEVLRIMTPASLDEEYGRISGALPGDPSAPNRLRAAMLLSRPETTFRDDARAQALLRNVLNDPNPDVRSYRPLAAFLLATAKERERSETELANERKQRQKLEQQLDQLKAIEKDFGKRLPPKPMNGQ